MWILLIIIRNSHSAHGKIMFWYEISPARCWWGTIQVPTYPKKTFYVLAWCGSIRLNGKWKSKFWSCAPLMHMTRGLGLATFGFLKKTFFSLKNIGSSQNTVPCRVMSIPGSVFRLLFRVLRHGRAAHWSKLRPSLYIIIII